MDRSLMGWGLGLTMILVLVGCSLAINPGPSTARGAVRFAAPAAKTVLPEAAEIQITHYTISGTGPSGATLASTPESSSEFTLEDLAAGDWVFQVEGWNSASVLVATGQVPVTIVSGGTVSANLTLAPVGAGVDTGTFSLTASWDATVPVNQVLVTVTPSGPSGTPTTGVAVISGSTLDPTYAVDLPVGSYLLAIEARTSDSRVLRSVHALGIYKALTSALRVSWGASSFRTLTVSRTGLLGEWLFNGNANDTSGNGNTGTVSGASLAADRFGNPGQAYRFDGTGSSIASQIPAVDSNSSLSVSLWFRADALENWYPFLFHLGSPDTYTVALGVRGSHPEYLADGSVGRFGMATNQSNAPNLHVGFKNPASLQRWYHLVATLDNIALEAQVFVNGVLVDTQALGSPTPVSLTNFLVGKSFHDGNEMPHDTCFQGAIDDVRIYGRALSVAEVADLYSEEGTVPEGTWSYAEEPRVTAVTSTTFTAGWAPYSGAATYDVYRWTHWSPSEWVLAETVTGLETSPLPVGGYGIVARDASGNELARRTVQPHSAGIFNLPLVSGTFADDFNAGVVSTAYDAASRGEGQITATDGYLQLSQTITDNGPTLSLAYDSLGKRYVTVEYRSFHHRAGDYYYGDFDITNRGNSVAEVRVEVAAHSAFDPIYGTNVRVRQLDRNYESVWTYDTTWGGHTYPGFMQEHILNSQERFDTWVNVKVQLDLEANTVTVWLDGVAQGSPVAVNHQFSDQLILSWWTNAWWTGHYQRLDDLSVHSSNTP